MVETLVTIYLAIIIASALLVGFAAGRIVELKRTERILREVADEMVIPQEGEKDDAEG